jgi:extracellular factor (EF) 3-hydroxypalmitic acid methyl ester biosynthesis protein
VRSSVRRLLTGQQDLGSFDFIYAAGLFDYLQQPVAQRLTSKMFQMLRRRGTLLIPNFVPGIRDIGYMESYVAWELIYRTTEEMLDLAAMISADEIAETQVLSDEEQNIVSLLLVKR